MGTLYFFSNATTHLERRLGDFVRGLSVFSKIDLICFLRSAPFNDPMYLDGTVFVFPL